MASSAVTASAVCRWCGATLDDGTPLPGRIRCARCGVATTDPWPTAAELDRAYAGAYRPADGRFSGIGDRLLRWTRGSLAARIDRIAPSGAVLDIGAGEGALLAALRRRGRMATGTERAAFGDAGPADDPPPADDLAPAANGWAAIVFWHSLEHLPDPAAAVATAAADLASGGVLIVAVPNADSLQARAFGARWLALDPPRHLVHLTAAALRERFQDLGLGVERVSYLHGGQVFFGWLDGLVGAVPPHLSLYDAVRRPDARFAPLSRFHRAIALACAALLAPVAIAAGAVEVAMRRGGTVYIEARTKT